MEGWGGEGSGGGRLKGIHHDSKKSKVNELISHKILAEVVARCVLDGVGECGGGEGRLRSIQLTQL